MKNVHKICLVFFPKNNKLKSYWSKDNFRQKLDTSIAIDTQGAFGRTNDASQIKICSNFKKEMVAEFGIILEGIENEVSKTDFCRFSLMFLWVLTSLFEAFNDSEAELSTQTFA